MLVFDEMSVSIIIYRKPMHNKLSELLRSFESVGELLWSFGSVSELVLTFGSVGELLRSFRLEDGPLWWCCVW